MGTDPGVGVDGAAAVASEATGDAAAASALGALDVGTVS